jgi:hypothetical protein
MTEPLTAEQLAEIRERIRLHWILSDRYSDAWDIAERAHADGVKLADEVERLRTARRDESEGWASYAAEQERHAETKAERDVALDKLESVREAVNTFCHGEQQTLEHVKYCVPILEALHAPTEAGDDDV